MKTQSNAEKKIFRMQISKKLLILPILVYPLCIGGISITAWRIAQFGIHEFLDVLRYPFLIAIQLLCMVVVTAFLLKAQYAVTDTHLIASYGIVKDKIEIKTVTSLIWDSDTSKMTVYMGEQFFLLSLRPEDSHEFALSIREKNKNVEYSFTNTEKKD